MRLIEQGTEERTRGLAPLGSPGSTQARLTTDTHEFFFPFTLGEFKVIEGNGASFRKDLKNKNLTEMTLQRCNDAKERRRNNIS